MKASLIVSVTCVAALYVGCGGESVTIGGQDLNSGGKGGQSATTTSATTGSGGASTSGTSASTTTGGAGDPNTGGTGGTGSTGADSGVPCGLSLLCTGNQHCCTNPVGPNQICTSVCTTDPCLGVPCFSPADVGTGPVANLTCWRTQMPFPPLDKSCSTKADCFIARHTINCCGSQTAVGINVSAKAQFSLAETTCGGGLCGCVSFATTAEDGQSENSGQPIDVDCMRGACSTFVR